MLTIRSPAFTHEGEIPARHACDGEDVSPALEFSGMPDGTRSLALIVDDPDAPDPRAPKMTWVHWVVVDLPADCRGLAEGAASLPGGARAGSNDWKRRDWGGPCPPVGRHRYYFKLHALDCTLEDLQAPSKAELLEAMEGHVLAEAVLMGTYQRPGQG